MSIGPPNLNDSVLMSTGMPDPTTDLRFTSQTPTMPKDIPNIPPFEMTLGVTPPQPDGSLISNVPDSLPASVYSPGTTPVKTTLAATASTKSPQSLAMDTRKSASFL